MLKTLVQYLPSSKMSNACQFVDLDASVTRKTILSRQQFSFNCWGLKSNHISQCYWVTFRLTSTLLKSCSDVVTGLQQTSVLMLRHFQTKCYNNFVRGRHYCSCRLKFQGGIKHGKEAFLERLKTLQNVTFTLMQLHWQMFCKLQATLNVGTVVNLYQNILLFSHLCLSTAKRLHLRIPSRKPKEPGKVLAPTLLQRQIYAGLVLQLCPVLGKWHWP